MHLSDFDYELPPELIAQEPPADRTASRLMVVHRATGCIEHHVFRNIGDYLQSGDLLVLNETKVLPVRLYGRKAGSGGRVELLLLRPGGEGENTWECLARPGRRLPPGTVAEFAAGLRGEVVARTAAGGRLVRFSLPAGKTFEAVLEEAGEVPLPPYIKKPLADPGRYQTVYAREPGSAAAPTAGMHFTPELLRSLRAAGVRTATLVLHIGLDTFRPVQTEDITAHRMHREHYGIPEGTSQAVNAAKREGRRVIAVGTTSTRCLETAALPDGTVPPGAGWSELFIYPGFRFKVIDALLTNFHLPRSTLLMLVSAFAGRELILAAYREAVERRYRFFSFGDAMLIL
ncbi:MAG: tRNA preQ1(34) S-adenosylmethionine ribosyltransferase-isomerase QueA [Thermoanaerobacterales bacterium]|nr:tRNA preQ1(34) S-adenosylmethionine ribosyltransferase-isomerase QueA [Bacillota bacterium]MDI6906806.1 tRNA preQ1(34) S-adenosylmethionine ribosyltransferase-isomerase QueA [Thermoanaerobacterales bacterium]